MVNELSITDDIFKITNQAYLKKDHGIDGFLATLAIVWLGEFV